MSKSQIERAKIQIRGTEYVATYDKVVSHPQQIGRLIALQRDNDVVWYHRGVVQDG